MASNKQTINFGKSRRWLNPRSNDCKAGVVWTVEVAVFPAEDGEEKDTAYIEAYFTTTEESHSHWVYQRSDLAPVRLLEYELGRYRKACLAALDFIEAGDYNCDRY